jgi:TrmH family RNA methyltransferase
MRSLHQKKVRMQERCYIVEGEKSVLEGISHAFDDLELLVCLESFFSEIPTHAHSKTQLIHQKELEQLSSLNTPNKCIAVFRQPETKVNDEGIIIALDGVQDPGNMGAILRLADWFGASLVVCSSDTVDCFNTKVVQASMGAIFRIPVLYTNLEQYLIQSKLPKYGALLNGKHYKKIDYPNKAILVMGNEGNGIRKSIENCIDTAITIPRIGQAESLNVATATAILMAEITTK